MVERIKRSSWKTSLIGSIIIIGAVISAVLGKTDWTTAGGAIAVGTGMLFTKDADK